MGIFDFLNQNNKAENIKDFLEANAVVVDVRSASEYAGGHIDNSVNIPLDTVGDHFGKWSKDKTQVIFCCASGMRSGTAAKKAKSAGVNAINGGGWTSLRKKVEAN
ncbi:MAG: rhodanese-like domain-containing protein [Cyclobacteriaceae bacterium]